jgi:hypothetical protein
MTDTISRAPDQVVDFHVSMSVRLTEADVEALRTDARAVGVRQATLARMYIVRGLRVERAKTAAQAA